MSRDFRGRKIVDFLLYLYLNEEFGSDESLAEIGRLAGYKGPGGYYEALRSLMEAGFIEDVKGEYKVTLKGKRFLKIDAFMKTFYVLGITLSIFGILCLYTIYFYYFKISIVNLLSIIFTLGIVLLILGLFLIILPRIFYHIQYTKKIKHNG